MHTRRTTRKRFQKHGMLRSALGLAVMIALTLIASVVLGQEVNQEMVEEPGARISLDLHSGDGGYVSALKIALLLAALTFAPSIILAMTSFTRIIVVLALLRQAVGVVQLPPTRVLVGLALFLTLFTMTPVLEEVDEIAIQPYEAGEIDEMAALKAAMKPLRMFMLKQTREEDLGLFLRVSHAPRPKNAEELSTTVIIPAFMLSELKAAFQMGALLFLPFLVIDMVVASILMSMGMMMLPPMTISLPLKLMVFVLTDGWGLVIKSLTESFTM